jgi:hypothetical protein
MLNRAYTSAQDLRVELLIWQHSHQSEHEGVLRAYFDPNAENYEEADHHKQEKRGDRPIGESPGSSYSSRAFAFALSAEPL